MKIIGVLNLQSKDYRKLFEALEDLFCIRFEERTIGDDVGIDAWFLNEIDIKTARIFTQGDIPSYATIHCDELIPCGRSQIIDFSKNNAITSVLRGIQIKTDEAIELMALPQQMKDFTIIASKAGFPVWAVQESKHCQHHYVAMSIPELNDDEPLFRYFHGRQFLRLLPFLIFLRFLTEDQRWEPPPLQACFMFDDPNLHWPTYGFIKFKEMIQHAKMYKYHSSIATIPLDTWFVHMPTASLFKEHHDKISLLIHGNDHTYKEFSRSCSEIECSEILCQALKRMDKFEHHSGVEISKVMAPPHGACSEIFLGKMSNVGFEAGCISKGSLHSYNRKAKWLFTLGMRPSDIIEGLTIFSRFPLSRNCHNSILIAALLHQPIIPAGHHQDLSEGLKILDDLSTFVNSLGDVRWADMKGISRSHFSRLIDGRTLRVRMFTKRIEVCVPEGIDKIWVERSRLQAVESESFTWRTLEDEAEWKPLRSDELISVSHGQKIEIIVNPETLLQIGENTFRRFRTWPIVRRLLTESRDRIAPALSRFSISGTS